MPKLHPSTYIDPDHRFVVTNFWSKIDWETGKTKEKPTKRNWRSSAQATELIAKKLRVKIYQLKETIKVKIWRKRRSPVFRFKKKRKAELDFMKMMADSENINNLKRSAQTALAQ